MLTYFSVNWMHVASVLFIPACIQLCAILVGVILDRIIYAKVIRKFAGDDATLQAVFIRALKGLPVAWCSGFALYLTMTTLEMSPYLRQFLSNALLGIILFSLTRVIARLASGIIDVFSQHNGSFMPKTTLLNNIVSIAIYCLGIMVILQSYGISVAPALAALGVGGIAVALGLQDTLANIFAGLQIIISRQIRIGDFIRLSSGEEGRVTDITWRFTTIKAFNNNLIISPNQRVATTILTNYTLPAHAINVVVSVGVSYDSDLELVEKVTLEVAKTVMDEINSCEVEPPFIRFHTFGSSSIDLNVVMQCDEYLRQGPLKHAFIKALTSRYREEGIEIPFPIRTVVNKK